jgi:hypothetical protein
MRVAGRVAILSGAAVLAACGSDPARLNSPTSAPAAPTAATSVTPSAAPTVTAPRTAAPTATTAPTAAGPVVLESTVYDYRVTVDPGPATLLPAVAEWDGETRITRDARFVDRVRTPLSRGAVFVVMSPDPHDDVDAFATDLVARYQRWHTCTDAKTLREFTSAGRPGRSWIQTCASAGESFARAVVVHEGRGILAFNELGTDPSTAQDRLISFLDDVELTVPAGS